MYMSFNYISRQAFRCVNGNCVEHSGEETDSGLQFGVVCPGGWQTALGAFVFGIVSLVLTSLRSRLCWHHTKRTRR